jgi:hypothetical protein
LAVLHASSAPQLKVQVAFVLLHRNAALSQAWTPLHCTAQPYSFGQSNFASWQACFPAQRMAH